MSCVDNQTFQIIEGMNIGDDLSYELFVNRIINRLANTGGTVGDKIIISTYKQQPKQNIIEFIECLNIYLAKAGISE